MSLNFAKIAHPLLTVFWVNYSLFAPNSVTAAIFMHTIAR